MNHTPSDHLVVGLRSNFTSAWPVIAERCVEPVSKGVFYRTLAELPHTHVEKSSRGQAATIHEKPSRFGAVDGSAETMANAQLWLCAGAMLELLRDIERIGEADFARLRAVGIEPEPSIIALHARVQGLIKLATSQPVIERIA